MSVVVAYSPDEFGEAALDHGVEEARRRGCELVLVNATKGDSYVDTRFAREEDVERLTSRLAAEGVPLRVVRTVVPDVAEEVVRVAVETGAATVVVGIRHRSPVGKALLGSVAQRVILDAPCPVVAVKPG